MPVLLAVTIHEISLVAHPEWSRRRRPAPPLADAPRRATAQVVFTVSQFSRSEIERHLGVDSSRIHVIPNGLTPRHLSSNGTAREPIVLFVGSIFNRRRIPDVIAAFARATSDLPQARLVIAGDDRTWPKQHLEAVAGAHHVADRTSFLHYVDDATIADLYARASAFAFLSEYEGFVTPLEALAPAFHRCARHAGGAQICADARSIGRGDIEATANALRRCLLDRGAWRLLANGSAVVQRYRGHRQDRTLQRSADGRTQRPTLSIAVSYNARVRSFASRRCTRRRRRFPMTSPSSTMPRPIVSRQRRSRRLAAPRILVQEQNRGFAAGTNAGIRASRGQLLLLLNSDTTVPAGAIDTLVQRMEAYPAAVAAGPRLVDTNGRAELSFGPMISPLGELRQRAIGGLYAAGFPGVTSWVERNTRREQFVDWVSGACLLVSREHAEAVGLLDERYFLYTEDVDFCAALRARGGRILFAPAAEIVHVRGRSRASDSARSNAAYRRSQVAFYEKHHPGWVPLLRAYLTLKGELPR